MSTATASATPAPSSPPQSESFLSEYDGTGGAPSLFEGYGYSWDRDGDSASGIGAEGVKGAGVNFLSWKVDLDAAEGSSSSYKRGFNAISTVLNHPTKKADPLRSSRKPLPSIPPPPPIPKPPPGTHYDAYLKSITPLYDSFASASANAQEPGPGSEIDTVGRARKLGVDLPPLDSVPDVYFDPAFDLSSPGIWDEVMASLQAQQPGEDTINGEKPVRTNGSSRMEDGDGDGFDTHDTLSTHLDTLERHLLHEISLRSTSFFSALSNLQDLHSESASCLSRISELQSGLKDVGEKQAGKGLEVIDNLQDLKVLRGVEAGMGEMGEVVRILELGRGLVEGGDWSGALGCLEEVSTWWSRHNGDPGASAGPGPGPSSEIEGAKAQATLPLPLSTLPAFSALPTVYASLTSAIATQLESALASLLLSVLAEVGSMDDFDNQRFDSGVRAMLSGLVRCGKIDSLEGIWREAVTNSIREGSRKHLPVSHGGDDDDEEGRAPESRGTNLAQSLKAMDHIRFLVLSREMYTTLLGRLHLAQRIGEELVKIVTDLSSQPVLSLSPMASTETPASASLSTPLDLSDVLASACELAHARAAKILAVRSEQHAALSLGDFVELFKENWNFVVASETLAKRMIVSLRGVTATQARTFLIAYHGLRLTKSAKLVEEEQWTQIDVSASIQHTVNLLITSAVSDPPECLVPPPSPGANANGTAGAVAAGKTLNVEEKTFFVVKATAESLTLLADYLKIVINLELVVMDVMSRIIEFLKSFNSRTCQVVLGAGAMRSAGLKNITAKHLALASQSLSVVVALIPYIREFIRRHLNAKQAVMLTEFDKLKRDYVEHQNEIHAKLVAIMSDRLSVHVGSLREIDWEASTEKETSARSYAEMLVKETATLHKVLSKYLASSTVEAVMSEVLAAIVHRLTEEYTKIELKSDEAKRRMMTDVTLLAQKLAPLAESGKTVASLQTLVKDKPLPRRKVGQAMAGLLRRAGSGSGSATSPNPGPEVDPTTDDTGAEEEGEGAIAITAEPEAVTTVDGEKISDPEPDALQQVEAPATQLEPPKVDSSDHDQPSNLEGKAKDLEPEPAGANETSGEDAPPIPSKDPETDILQPREGAPLEAQAPMPASTPPPLPTKEMTSPIENGASAEITEIKETEREEEELEPAPTIPEKD